MLLADQSWTRIIKPPKEAGMVSIILYDKAAGATIKPEHIVLLFMAVWLNTEVLTLCKQFGACIYHAEEFAAMKGGSSSDAIQLEGDAVVAFIL